MRLGDELGGLLDEIERVADEMDGLADVDELPDDVLRLLYLDLSR